MSGRTLVMVVPDLLFGTRILETARALGVEVTSLAAPALPAHCLAEPPSLVILDLLAPGQPLAAVRALRADPRTAGIPVTGFYPHVEDTVRQAAIEAGVTTVLPRSAFHRRLAELLRGAPVADAGDGD